MQALAPVSTPFANRAPFRLSRGDAHAEPAALTGALPSLLTGTLVRTCPAIFRGPGWNAGHWFDGLGMMYAFRLQSGAVSYDQRLLASLAHDRVMNEEGREKPGGFGTPPIRSFWQRLFQPLPEMTDNANVNVVPLGGEFVAMTETPFQ